MTAGTGTLNWFRMIGGAKAKSRKSAIRRTGTPKDGNPHHGWDSVKKPRRRQSFTDFLPWMEYLPSEKMFLLEDGRSVGAVWEIQPVGTEGRTDDFKAMLWERAFNIIADAVPETDPDPWVLQVFVSNDFDLSKQIEDARSYATPLSKGTTFEVEHHAALERHYERVSRAGGIFKDEMSDTHWRGKVRRVRFVLFRRSRQDSHDLPPIEELGDVAAKLELAFANAGVRADRYDGEDFYNWLVQWLNPRPAICDGDMRRLRAVAPYPGDDNLPFGRDFSELLCFSEPEAFPDKGYIEFDGLPHAVLTTSGLRKQPKVGQFTGEQIQGDRTFAVMDKFPDEANLAIAITFTPQDIIQEHVGRVERASVGDQIDAQLAGEEALAVKEKMGRGDRLYPVETVIYAFGESERDLRRKLYDISGQLSAIGIQPIARHDEQLGVDRWLGNLPMAYRPETIKKTKRARLQFASHIAASLPVYGRARGSGHPGIPLWNRGGEPFWVDPLNPVDRKKNGHGLIIGPTGAGKSAFLINALLQLMAIYRPRLFIVEVGGSFNLFADHLERHGLAVNRVTLRPGELVSLPPFADALKLLGGTGAASFGGNNDDPNDERRDVLGEMEIAAKLMITGGRPEEMQLFSRSDQLAVRQAIMSAAKTVELRGGQITRPIDVAAALREQSKDSGLTEVRRDRVRALADAQELFADDNSLAGQLFNREGEAWPDADVTVVDLATLAREGYGGELAVAYIGLMNHINNLIEQRQHERRQTIVVTDEAHIITRNPLLAAYVVKVVKMWRKLGTWYWAATQNLEDFHEDARRMLSMFEWCFGLVMPQEEVEQLARFRTLDDQKKRLLLSARKEPGKHVEGVVLSDTENALFRGVPMPLALALAMNEKHEKSERAEIMAERSLKHEVEAAYVVARRLEGRE